MSTSEPSVVASAGTPGSAVAARATGSNLLVIERAARAVPPPCASPRACAPPPPSSVCASRRGPGRGDVRNSRNRPPCGSIASSASRAAGSIVDAGLPAPDPDAAGDALAAFGAASTREGAARSRVAPSIDRRRVHRAGAWRALRAAGDGGDVAGGRGAVRGSRARGGCFGPAPRRAASPRGRRPRLRASGRTRRDALELAELVEHRRRFRRGGRRARLHRGGRGGGVRAPSPARSNEAAGASVSCRGRRRRQAAALGVVRVTVAARSRRTPRIGSPRRCPKTRSSWRRMPSARVSRRGWRRCLRRRWRPRSGAGAGSRRRRNAAAAARTAVARVCARRATRSLARSHRPASACSWPSRVRAPSREGRAVVFASSSSSSCAVNVSMRSTPLR